VPRTPPPHPVIGHRGNAAHAPENTLESFRQAAALGVDALEMDVHLTADGAVIVLHDPTLDRTTDASGRVDHLAFAQVAKADAGARFTRDGGATHPCRGRGVTVPAFESVLAEFPEMPLLIELKTPRVAIPLRGLIERHGAQDRCTVAAFEQASVLPFRGSGIAIGSSRRDALALLPRALLGLAARRAPPFDVMCIPRSYRGLPLPIGGFVRSLAPAGVPVHVWTVDDPAVARALWRKGVSGIITNDPGAILAERRRRYGA
jgi:glycerophosphoryl diester phosphodiesterase